jgi:hypothetical protein
MREKFEILKNHPDSAAKIGNLGAGESGNVLSVDQDLATGWDELGIEKLEEGRFSGSGLAG